MRSLLLGIGIALTLVLLTASPARGAKYTVAQCGWRVGVDAVWAQSTGPQGFRSQRKCQPQGDPFEGARLRSLTLDGTRSVPRAALARWRWRAPSGTGIVNVRGFWWQALHRSFEHRLGVGDGGGEFLAFAAARQTETVPRPFAAGFAEPRRAFESRLLCAAAERGCETDPPSFAAVRALTITLQDSGHPNAAVAGELVGGGWLRGTRTLSFRSSDAGSGLRLGETEVDGIRAARTEHRCAKARIGGAWRATRMRPCDLQISGSHAIPTAAFSDGPHSLRHCGEDFAGNVGCSEPVQVLFDNTAPQAPRRLTAIGGRTRRSARRFRVTWVDPGQGAASPIAAAGYRIRGRGGFDSGPRHLRGEGIAALRVRVPGLGPYRLRVWLRDAAGNESPRNAATAVLRPRRPARVTLEVRPRAVGPGEEIRLRGRVRPSDAIPHRGKLVAIQFYERAARRWRPALLLRTDRDGRFSREYRFRSISGRALIRLRAAVPGEARWPYAFGASRAVSVRVG